MGTQLKGILASVPYMAAIGKVTKAIYPCWGNTALELIIEKALYKRPVLLLLWVSLVFFSVLLVLLLVIHFKYDK